MNTKTAGNSLSIFFDLDDTILDFHKAEAIALSKALSELDVDHSADTLKLYSRINDQQWKRLEKGLATRDEILLRRFEILFSELRIDASAEKARDLYEDHLCEGHFFIDGVPEVLDELYPEYELYIISNGTGRVQESRMKSAGINKYFRNVFISEKIGANKPDAEFFKRCFSQIPGFEKKRAVIVGDSLSSDILGGVNAGIKTVWYNPRHLPEDGTAAADFTISHMSELPELLKTVMAQLIKV